ncbi:hypothetical protein EYF80_013111 [Liparis tanakae]|uniref:Uncharacterized protein n=1 Tax=Liparis tanakae TaxID=230148 RepID=A0A4Z2IF45_9TELE|nr:hypothetical protein EYF80_013111 [Liparis tanakae]
MQVKDILFERVSSSPQQVGRPDDGQVLAVHVGDVAERCQEPCHLRVHMNGRCERLSSEPSNLQVFGGFQGDNGAGFNPGYLFKNILTAFNRRVHQPTYAAFRFSPDKCAADPSFK